MDLKQAPQNSRRKCKNLRVLLFESSVNVSEMYVPFTGKGRNAEFARNGGVAQASIGCCIVVIKMDGR